MSGTEQERMVDCASHGRRRISFACTHIAQGLLDGTSPGFVVVPEPGETLPLAWCEDCEALVAGEGGGSWSDEKLRRRADFKLLCEGCYVEAKGLAISAGRFRSLR